MPPKRIAAESIPTREFFARVPDAAAPLDATSAPKVHDAIAALVGDVGRVTHRTLPADRPVSSFAEWQVCSEKPAAAPAGSKSAPKPGACLTFWFTLPPHLLPAADGPASLLEAVHAVDDWSALHVFRKREVFSSCLDFILGVGEFCAPPDAAPTDTSSSTADPFPPQPSLRATYTCGASSNLELTLISLGWQRSMLKDVRVRKIEAGRLVQTQRRLFASLSRAGDSVLSAHAIRVVDEIVRLADEYALQSFGIDGLCWCPQTVEALA